ncbi:MAG: 3-dehydroquinate synthase [Nitrospirae bacterium]|nr:3-dehydroquinate synthase [Nitrospirota bacterium]
MMKNIVLIGFMGTGKSEVGKRLAGKLGWSFEDTDLRIVERAGSTIPEIFKRSGERYFRKLERTVVSELAQKKSCVIATGGGAVLDPVNLKNLRRNGLLIGLEASPDAIIMRTAGSDRPLLLHENRHERIERLLSARRPYYGLSDHRIDTTHRTIDQVVDMIKEVHRLSDSDPIRLDLGERSYAIEIGRGTIGKLGERLVGLGLKGKAAVVTNPRVKRLYGAVLTRGLGKAGFDVTTVILPDGERFKNLKSVSTVYDALLRTSFERGSTIIALGGGVIGDLAGFAAATFMRGINFVQVPTTLAAQVDASIGGKTGVDHPKGKNLIGAFYQPRLVFIDPDVLKTLDRREFVSGLAEVIKYGVIADEEFFSYLEDNMDKILKKEPAALTHATRKSCGVKAAVVQKDEREGGLRKILNYGHTFGHALETITNYRTYLHGEAVSIGMAFAAKLAVRLGLTENSVARRQIMLLQKAGLPVALPKIKTADILKSMRLDKKVSGGRIHFVLADRIGHVAVEPVEEKEIQGLLKAGF